MQQKKQLLDAAKTSLLTVISRPDIVMSCGKGMFLYDTDGNEYLDFLGGWAVNCLGHSPEVISSTLCRQASRLVNSSPAFYNEPMLEYAELLTDNCCLDRVFFCCSGAEANEGAIKLARKYGQVHKNGASDIITTKQGFHGRTLATMAATGKKQWESLFEPKPGGFLKADFNDLKSFERLITDGTCAIMLELIQGEGGINVADSEFITGLRQLCDQHDILLIFDEIQTGMGRTGTLFCYEQYAAQPDIMTLGKGIGGGFPLAAMLAKEKLNIFDPGDQGGTYTGQSLAMAVGLAVLQELLEKDLPSYCRRMGTFIRDGLKELSENHEIANIRGRGLLIAFDLLHSEGNTFVQKCLADKLLINSPQAQTVRLMPPLIVSEEEVMMMLELVKANLAQR